MSRASKNRLTAGNSQPVKTISKHASDFIAITRNLTSGFHLDRGICPGSILCILLALLAIGVLV